MNKQVVLTGITTTGSPHLGNYVGAIRPAIEASRNPASQSFYFLADYHALVKCQEPERLKRSTMEVAAAWLALGLDTETSIFYRQSDIPEVMELTWILSCVAAKGLLNRAHAYKAAVAENDANQSRGPRPGRQHGALLLPGADGGRHSDVQRPQSPGGQRPNSAPGNGPGHRRALQPSFR